MQWPSCDILIKPLMNRYAERACMMLASDEPPDAPGFPFERSAAALLMWTAGADKALSTTCLLLYCVGIIDDQWFRPPKHAIEAGFIGCGNGLGEKLQKLTELGAVRTNIGEYIESRNKYAHEVMLAVRYEPEGNGVILFDFTHIDHGFSTTLVTVTPDELRSRADQLASELVAYLDGTRASEFIWHVFQYVREIPAVPPDKIEKFKSDAAYRDAWLRQQNAHLFGRRWSKLIPTIRRRMGIP